MAHCWRATAASVPRAPVLLEIHWLQLDVDRPLINFRIDACNNLEQCGEEWVASMTTAVPLNLLPIPTMFAVPPNSRDTAIKVNVGVATHL